MIRRPDSSSTSCPTARSSGTCSRSSRRRPPKHGSGGSRRRSGCFRSAGSAERRRRPQSAAAHHAADGCHQLFGALFLLGLRAADDAVVRVVVEESQRDLVECRLDRRDLSQDVDAIAVVLDHPLDAAHLALDAAQALEELVLGRAVAARLGHGCHGQYTLWGYTASVERGLNEVDGVTATVNFATERAAVEYDPSRVSPSNSSARSRLRGTPRSWRRT